jgi:hypothetical protein
VSTAGELVGPWCPTPPILGPLVFAKIYPPRDLAVYPTRSRGPFIEVRQVLKGTRQIHEKHTKPGFTRRGTWRCTPPARAAPSSR